MDIEGTYTLQATPEEVWQHLTDHQVLLHAIPGVEQLEKVDDQTYSLHLHIAYAPLIGTYQGQTIVTEKQPPYQCHVAIEGMGRQSSFRGEGTLHLRTHEDMTVITYTGTLHIGKLGTLLPPTLTRGVAKLLLQEFFNEIASALRASQHEREKADILIEEYMGATVVKRRVSQAEDTAHLTETRTPLLQRLVHLAGLGAGDPFEEARWTERLRRIGVVSALLFLVWVGTRLPRK
jgi:carbon monoxide dehydrogenase subunit G